MEKEVIGIVGAGIAGSRLAWLLASDSKKVFLFDHRAPWEKPCGGGLTYKIFREFKDLKQRDLGGENHRLVQMVFPKGRRIKLSLYQGIYTISRETLGKTLLDRAVHAGAEFRPEKVQKVQKSGEGFRIESEGGGLDVDFLIGADGVRSVVREEFSRPFDREDMILAYSFLLPATERMPLVIRFFQKYAGYAWMFPRPGQIAAGIALSPSPEKKEQIIELLEEFVQKEFKRAEIEYPGPAEPRAWLLPNLRTETLQDPGVAGKGWALAGDAAGAADPITGEGIYYAFKTAHLIHRALQAGDLESYVQTFQKNIAAELSLVSPLREKFFANRTLRALGVMLDYSPAVRMLTRDLIGGYENYANLKPRVKSELNKYLKECSLNLLTFNKGQRKRRKRP
ncbi:MAG: NAD(P)/FAD-dependent oxidoreductase [bacterium]